MTNKEKAIKWFEIIADECDKLTSGNVAHLRAQIKGMAIRSAEYLEKHSQEPASKELEKEIEKYFAQWYQGATDEGCINSDSQLVSIYDCIRIAKHFAEWGSAHLTNKASKIASEDLDQAKKDAWFYYEYRDTNGRLYQSCFGDGFEHGVQWKKEQMMKDAVEGRMELNHIVVSYAELAKSFPTGKDGNKVKVIIIKE